MNWIKHQHEPRHLGVPSDVSKMISEPTVCLAQTVHLSCTDTNTFTKWTKMRFHMTHVTMDFQRVCPIRFLRLWYIRQKPCTYLASRLALSPNGLNRASTWASSPRRSSGASKMIYEPRYIWRKQCTYLASTLTLSPNGPKRDSTWPTSPSSSIWCVQNDFQACSTFGPNYAPILRED
jgi:hypothetical protein